MQLKIIWVFAAIFSSLASSMVQSRDLLISEIDFDSIPVMRGLIEGQKIGGGKLKLDKNASDTLRNILYPKKYPLSDEVGIGSGHWNDEDLKLLRPEAAPYTILCGEKVLCVLLRAGVFYWVASFSSKQDFIDAVPVYGWQSETEGNGLQRKNKRKMALESDIFATSKQLVPDIEAYTPQTASRFAFGISDAHALCSHFVETSYVPYEHTAHEETRVYRLKSDGHFEVIQEGSCVLGEEKIAELGLTSFIDQKANDSD